ncbi:MAG: hypothetical protein HY081_12135 [Gammaproteobacteria bacterium]|nr:hypothetical protein [Gammaproteobacteria bacterium]
MRGKPKYLLVTAVAALAVGLFGVAALAADVSGTKPAGLDPTAKVYKGKGDQCVEPTEIMRRDHMKMVLHQRDETMHKGIRTQKYSLKNCIDCHADPQTNSVLGKNGFCESCHQYAAVTIDCFSCHNPSPEKNTRGEKAATTPMLRNMTQTSVMLDNASGVQP